MVTPVPAADATSTALPPNGGGVTNLAAHNLRLHQGPNFRIYVQWLRGQMQQAHKGVTPSFDDPESFYLNVTNGVIRANLGDICNYLNAAGGKSPLRDINITGVGSQVKITGKLHKLITLPVELSGTILPASGNRLQMHITKIDLLKIPFKALLSGFHVKLSDLVGSTKIAGVEVKDNDIFFDPELLLPPPHIRGSLTKVSMASPDLEAVYGNATQDVERVERWRNFLSLEHGSLRFGKLTMTDVDLLMIDISQDDWFDLDLANYQEQLISGYTRITPQAGLQIFMPNFSDVKKSVHTDTSVQWFKNRNVAPPSAVVPKN